MGLLNPRLGSGSRLRALFLWRRCGRVSDSCEEIAVFFRLLSPNVRTTASTGAALTCFDESAHSSVSCAGHTREDAPAPSAPETTRGESRGHARLDKGPDAGEVCLTPHSVAVPARSTGWQHAWTHAYARILTTDHPSCSLKSVRGLHHRRLGLQPSLLRPPLVPGPRPLRDMPLLPHPRPPLPCEMVQHHHHHRRPHRGLLKATHSRWAQPPPSPPAPPRARPLQLSQRAGGPTGMHPHRRLIAQGGAEHCLVRLMGRRVLGRRVGEGASCAR
jgi:hypothetical protein